MISITKKEEIVSRSLDLLSDESRFTLGIPSAVFFPENEEELQELMKALHKENRPITFSGARTGITGGAVPTNNCALISFSKMNKIKEITEKDNVFFLICEAGVTLGEINSFLKKPNSLPYHVSGIEKLNANEWFYAPDPTEMTAQLGGTIITNASGARSFKYGSTRESVVSLSVILASGEKAFLTREEENLNLNQFTLKTDSGREIKIQKQGYNSLKIKNAAGYFSSPNMNAIDLFIGSEGTLGAISKATIKLQKRYPYTAGLSFFPNHTSAFSFADFLRSKNETVAIEYFDETTIPFIIENKDKLIHKLPDFPINGNCAVYWEYLDPTSFIENSEIWNNELKKNGSSLDKTWSGYTDKEKDLLKQFRHSVPEIINLLISNLKINHPKIRKISSDTSVPSEHFSELYKYYKDLLSSIDLNFVVFGHLGDYHLHFNIIPRNNDEMEKSLNAYKMMMVKAIELKGTVSAEHGIGKIKKEYLQLMYNNIGILEMQKIKALLDPQNRLNPETLF